jgi:hypothetical protein
MIFAINISTEHFTQTIHGIEEVRRRFQSSYYYAKPFLYFCNIFHLNVSYSETLKNFCYVSMECQVLLRFLQVEMAKATNLHVW